MKERRTFLKHTGMVLLDAVTVRAVSPKMSVGSERLSQPAMIIDVNRCTGCNSCIIACKEQNLTPSGYFNTRVEKKEIGTYPKAWPAYIPDLCHQCRNAPCITACQYDATFILDSGIVVTDWSRCTGDGACVAACPYGARFQDANNGNKADKCNFCIDRLEQNLVPACVENCPSRARIFGDLANPRGEFAAYLKRFQATQTKDHRQERTFHINASKS